ncbi:transposase InsO family protein [Rhizobium azooxidifex]|uniref:Transposase InsO family protein n=1 Tax=Mycoplana azooxidifex TaxID=1636188 RepID=A0A7W6GLM9_9HYPH|nr:transposase InsO family protein [Mycoplana azooxidifex]
MISFIDAHRSVLGVEPICRLLPIAPSTYYEVIAKRNDVDRLSARARRDIAMKVEIRRVFNENFQVYGVRKVWRQLLREGYDIARCTVARLMKAMALQGIIRGKPIRTTISDKAAPCPLDRVNRQFFAPAPNMLWLSDFTYVATWQGFVYVAFVIDAFARRIVGWRASRTAHAGFVLDALDQALHDRRPVHRGGLVHHSDRGSQYVSIRYSERLAEAGIEPSVGSVGDSYDNALAETINGLYKAEVIHRRGHGETSKQWSSPRSNGSIGSTTAAFWSPSETFRQPRPKTDITPCWTHQPWPRNLNQTVSGKAGAVHIPTSKRNTVLNLHRIRTPH